jgi:hypothetical protein
MAEIKKTMLGALAFVTENGNMSEDNLEQFTIDFCVKSAKGESKPRIATKLFDSEGVLLGGRCSATEKWFPLSDFNHHHGLAKEAQNIKSRFNTEAKTLEGKANGLLDAARDLTDMTEKLAKFEEYDDALAEATEVRNQPVEVENFGEDKHIGCETIDELAIELGVDVITTKPKTVT